MNIVLFTVPPQIEIPTLVFHRFPMGLIYTEVFIQKIQKFVYRWKNLYRSSIDRRLLGLLAFYKQKTIYRSYIEYCIQTFYRQKALYRPFIDIIPYTYRLYTLDLMQIFYRQKVFDESSMEISKSIQVIYIQRTLYWSHTDSRSCKSPL